jgi:hypothetical protein
LYEYPQRYNIHAQEGLIHVMRVVLKLCEAFNFWCSTAASAISALYAWYTVIVVGVNLARIWRKGVGSPVMSRLICSR